MQNFDYDVKLAVTVDDEVKTNIPEADSKDDEGNYYKVGVSCDNDIKGEWDYNAWTLKLDNVINGTKCRLTFTSNMSAAERDNIIKQGVQIRRNTYRGKDITEYLENGTLFDMIKSGKFNDIYVGDYMVSPTTKDADGNKIVWLIADLDNYLGVGDPENGLQQHHATIIPAYKLAESQMNSQNEEELSTTEGGYGGSEMINTLDKIILPKYIIPDFDNHVIEYSNLISTEMDPTRTNMYGLETGASSNWIWTNRKLDLMSEVNVYGTTVWSSNGYDIGADNRQYAIFQLRPELINQDLSGIVESTPRRYTYWLKSVATSEYFTYVRNTGNSHAYKASSNLGIRPRFLID